MTFCNLARVKTFSFIHSWGFTFCKSALVNSGVLSLQIFRCRQWGIALPWSELKLRLSVRSSLPCRLTTTNYSRNKNMVIRRMLPPDWTLNLILSVRWKWIRNRVHNSGSAMYSDAHDSHTLNFWVHRRMFVDSCNGNANLSAIHNSNSPSLPSDLIDEIAGKRAQHAIKRSPVFRIRAETFVCIAIDMLITSNTCLHLVSLEPRKTRAPEMWRWVGR